MGKWIFKENAPDISSGFFLGSGGPSLNSGGRAFSTLQKGDYCLQGDACLFLNVQKKLKEASKLRWITCPMK